MEFFNDLILNTTILIIKLQYIFKTYLKGECFPIDKINFKEIFSLKVKNLFYYILDYDIFPKGNLWDEK